MGRPKYYTLSTGYKVEVGREDTEEHLANAIFGELLVDLRRTLQPCDLDRFNDHLVRRFSQECEYLSKRYNLVFWRLLSDVMNRMHMAMVALIQSVDEGCESCEHKDHCKTRGMHQAPCSDADHKEMN
jgi:hypothetical protein